LFNYPVNGCARFVRHVFEINVNTIQFSVMFQVCSTFRLKCCGGMSLENATELATFSKSVTPNLVLVPAECVAEYLYMNVVMIFRPKCFP